MSSKKQSQEVRAAADACLLVLREDSARLKRLLRETAALADELKELLADAERAHESKQLGRLSKLLRGTALLPASLGVAALNAALNRLLPDSAK